MTAEYLWCDDQLRRPCDGVRALRAERDRLREALGGLATAVKNYRDFEPEWNVGPSEWSAESTAAWERIQEILDANLIAAHEALTGGHQ